MSFWEFFGLWISTKITTQNYQNFIWYLLTFEVCIELRQRLIFFCLLIATLQNSLTHWMLHTVGLYNNDKCYWWLYESQGEFCIQIMCLIIEEPQGCLYPKWRQVWLNFFSKVCYFGTTFVLTQTTNTQWRPHGDVACQAVFQSMRVGASSLFSNPNFII